MQNFASLQSSASVFASNVGNEVQTPLSHNAKERHEYFDIFQHLWIVVASLTETVPAAYSSCYCGRGGVGHSTFFQKQKGWLNFIEHCSFWDPAVFL
jgi:hypothetical protein